MSDENEPASPLLRLIFCAGHHSFFFFFLIKEFFIILKSGGMGHLLKSMWVKFHYHQNTFTGLEFCNT